MYPSPVRSLASLAASSGSIKAPYLFVRIMWWTPTRRRPPVSETRLRYRFTGRNISQVWPYRRTPPRQQHQGILSRRGLQMSLSRPCRGQSRDTRPSKSKAHTVSLELTMAPVRPLQSLTPTRHPPSSKMLTSGRTTEEFRNLELPAAAHSLRWCHRACITSPRIQDRIHRDGMEKRRLTWKLSTEWRPMPTSFTWVRQTTIKTWTRR